MKIYAKKVYSFDLFQTIDRTKESHSLGNFDVDFRKKDSKNLRARKWTYGGSRKTLKAIQNDAKKLENKLGVETRLVNAETGEILKASC